MNFREYYNQKDCNIQNNCLGSTTINRNVNVREYLNQNDCEGLSQSKGIPGSIKIKMSAREYNKIVLSGSITIKTTARDHPISKTARKYQN